MKIKRINRLAHKKITEMAKLPSPQNQRTVFELKNLCVSIENKEIIKNFSLTIKSGEIHIVMGPNGSGKSTLCYALMGHPKYKITSGQALMNGQNVLELTVDKRAQLGLFLGFQYPREIPGVTFGNFLRMASNALLKGESGQEKSYSPAQFLPVMQKNLDLLKMQRNFIGRGINEGFSGGEKKRAEIVQLAVLRPKIAMLDEVDSGLDIDALKIVAAAIQEIFNYTNMGILLITHYQRILNYLKPHFVHVMVDGRIVKSGRKELALELEKSGYLELIKNYKL